MTITRTTPSARLHALELSYAEQINFAVAEDRPDLIADLSAQFEQDRRRLTA